MTDTDENVPEVRPIYMDLYSLAHRAEGAYREALRASQRQGPGELKEARQKTGEVEAKLHEARARIAELESQRGENTTYLQAQLADAEARWNEEVARAQKQDAAHATSLRSAQDRARAAQDEVMALRRASGDAGRVFAALRKLEAELPLGTYSEEDVATLALRVLQTRRERMDAALERVGELDGELRKLRAKEQLKGRSTRSDAPDLPEVFLDGVEKVFGFFDEFRRDR